MDTEQFELRKRDHIHHALDAAHQATGLSGLDRVHLIHEALPDLDFQEVSLTSICLGKSALTPFYIAGITAGHASASQVNLRLALACAERGWAMGVGSQRRDLELETNEASIDQWRHLREKAPSLTLFANLGIAQVITASVQKIQRLVDMIHAQALAVHVNALQECMQPEGTPRFKGALTALRRLTESLTVPVILKETGCGFSFNTLQRLQSLNLGALDVSGLGGTHWGRIEGARAEAGGIQSTAAITFGQWGESTADSVLAARKALPELETWASGGVRSGLDAAKLIALGAHRVGYAQPALAAAMAGDQALRQWMEIQEYELKVALFCTGCQSPEALRKKENVWKPSGF